MIQQKLGLQPKEYKRVVPALFAYLFNRIDLKKFISFVGNQAEGNRIKDIARKDGYLLKNCKLYAYACYVNRLAGQKLPSNKEFEVDDDDASILKRLNLD